MSEICLDQNELQEAAEALRAAGRSFSQQGLEMSGRRSTISAIDLLSETFAEMQEGFVSVKDTIDQLAAALCGSGDAIVKEDAAAADKFE